MRQKQFGWIFVWRDHGKAVSKEKVFSSTLTDNYVVQHQIARQVVPPPRYPKASPTVLGRMQL